MTMRSIRGSGRLTGWLFYVRQLFRQAARDTWANICGVGVGGVIAKVFLVSVYSALAYNPDLPLAENGTFFERLSDATAQFQAFVIAAILFFIVHLLFAAPFHIWESEKKRADAVNPEYDPAPWMAMSKLSLAQIACLWVGKSPALSENLPDHAALILHRLKAAIENRDIPIPDDQDGGKYISMVLRPHKQGGGHTIPNSMQVRVADVKNFAANIEDAPEFLKV